MPTIPEFIEFLKYTKDNAQDIYEDITAERSPWRAEWLDAYFEQRSDGLYILTNNKTKSERLDDYTLLFDRLPGNRISGTDLEDWLNNPTKQGLPNHHAKEGSLLYWCPEEDGRVARFYAGPDRIDLKCDRYPQYPSSALGVRAVREK